MKLAISAAILGVVWLGVAIWDAGNLRWAPRMAFYFVDLPQLLYVLLPAIGVTAVVHTWSGLISGVALGLGLTPQAEKQALVLGARSLRFMGWFAWWGGLGVSTIEVVISAHNSPSIADFLPALGVSMLGVFYGLAVRLICSIGVQVIKIRLGPFVYYSE